MCPRDETPSVAALVQDRGQTIGNSVGDDDRGRLHTVIKNTVAEPVPVSGSFSASPGGFAPPANTDAMQASYPDPVTEVYQFFNGGLAGTLLQTNTVVYTDATKNLVDTVVKT
jgi:hypothetical protein